MKKRTLLAYSQCFMMFYNCTFAQQKVQLVDGLNAKECTEIQKVIDSKPREVLWGIDYVKEGEVVITINNKDWLYKILKNPLDGISVDLIDKDLFSCKIDKPVSNNLLKGESLNPIYLNDIKKKAKGEKLVEIELGKIPKILEGKEIEGNFMIVRDKKVCHYQAFIQIPRSRWGLLPMGLFTNNFIQEKQNGEEHLSFIYEKKLQFIVPFPKNKATYSQNDLKMVFDSLANTGFKIKKIDIRAYSSIEGTTENNTILQEKRANAMIDALKQFQASEIEKSVSTAENWIEFMKDIQGTNFKNLTDFSQENIKKELNKKATSDGLEPILQKHRKAILTIYLDKKSGFEQNTNENLLPQFTQAIQKKELSKAVSIQKEIFDRITEKKLPTDFLNQLEVPDEKKYSVLVNNKIVFDNLIDTKKQKEILERFQKLLELDQSNGRIRYNIAAIKMKIWQNDSTIIKSNAFFEEIKELRNYKIDNSLVRRMLMNYYILKSEQHLDRNEYKAKDQTVDLITMRYKDLNLTDEDLFSLSKFLTFYSKINTATDILNERLDKIDVGEDLLFYYINLKLFDETKMLNQDFLKAVENATIINRKRFCKYFDAIRRGGASFQLLDDSKLRKFYCEKCQ